MKGGEVMRKIGKFNLIQYNLCRLPCKCGWNIQVGGKDEKDYKWLLKMLEKRSKK